MTSIRVTLLAAVAALGMTLPAGASPATPDTGPVQPTPFQYAQCKGPGCPVTGSSPVDYGYKTAKCKKSDKKCQAKSKKKKKSDTSDTKG
jgi:hypothetical protein